MKSRYKGICPVCGKILYICKSIAMENGINIGHCCCLQCKNPLSVTFDKKRQEMNLKLTSDYIARKEAESE